MLAFRCFSTRQRPHEDETAGQLVLASMFEQEEVLIERINRLSDRAMPPTSHIVRNLAEEIRGGRVGKNWTGQFIKRHNIRLKSLYLRNIDSLRAGAEYAPMFQLFFSVVSDFFVLFRVRTL